MQRIIVLAATAVLATGVVYPAAAEFKPTRPIEIVVHNGPGSGPDIFGRTLVQIIDQEKLSPVRLQVVNKIGGGGTTAASYVVNKKGDPHVWTVFTSVWITNPLVQQEASTKLVDMSPIARRVADPPRVRVAAGRRVQ